MWSRRGMLLSSAALVGSAIGRRARAADAPPPIGTADFAGTAAPAARSAAYDAERPFLFEDLAPRFATRVVRSCFLPMRDGVRLSIDFHVPIGASLPLPVILVRTPYSKGTSHANYTHIFPEQGFVFAIQDVRGRYESEGEFVANTGQDREDAYDTVSWIADQPWCNGAVGAMGSSYLGETAAKLAAMRHPNHRASIIMFDGANAAGLSRCGAFIQGGIVLLRATFGWFRDACPKISYGPPAWVDRQRWFRSDAARAYTTQPVKQPPIDVEKQLRTLPVVDMLDRTGAAPSDFAEWMRRADDPDSAYFERQRFITAADRIDTPTLHVTGPQEQGGSGPDNFNLFRRNAVSARARDNQYLLFTPAPHSGIARATAHSVWGARDFGDTRFPYHRMFVDWFGHWLRGDPAPVATWPKARFFVAGRNRWDQATAWPPADVTPVKLHLRGGGVLATDAPLRDEAPATFRYDPADPTPSEPPGAELAFVGGYGDQRALEARADILIYSSAPLAADLEIAGPVSLLLHVSSSAPDTDFAGTLCEVDADGRVVNVTQGIARMRFREGLDRKVWMTPGVVVSARVDLWHAAIRFRRGNRIRLHVGSALFPAFDRNLNTGDNNQITTAMRIADNAIHHGPAHPSHLLLPVRRWRAGRTI